MMLEMVDAIFGVRSARDGSCDFQSVRTFENDF